MFHTKCRGRSYPFGEVKRFIISDQEVKWNVPLLNYNPPDYNSPTLKNKHWADLDLDDYNFNPKWNTIDNNVDRQSFTGSYEICNGRPLNPEGRTGIKGRGVLGRWGPNHAADPIVTRWKLVDDKPEMHKSSKLPILQFCAIQRRDCGQWAIPGGMVDPDEKISETLKREFLEETVNHLENNSDQSKQHQKIIEEFFKNGIEIYKGYVDDPRNTDNAWIETVAVNFHDVDGGIVGNLKLNAGDDAANVRWIDIEANFNLYASHAKFIEKVAKLHKAHF